ncbi:hypothetical protein DY000_02062170 [Brassica cretica]|uniref:Xylanase inhibitor N-terminal domain-containing protein n=1 Tax=Brassica cretica TaxID=69181 RepID=A0ABQ7AU15_BRACR|nr:hypothetical protein DY000_02062170 [Brassica cretica]
MIAKLILYNPQYSCFCYLTISSGKGHYSFVIDMIACGSLHYFVSSSQSLRVGIDFESTSSIIGAIYALSSISINKNLGFTMKKLIGLDRLICTEPPLAPGQFFGLLGGVSSRTSTDLNPASASQSYRITDWTELAFSKTAANQIQVGGHPVCRFAWLRTHAPRHLVLHMAGCMSRTHAGCHHSYQMSGCMTGTHARHHIITHMASCMRGDTSCVVDPPRASICQAACAASMNGDTSSFWRHSACWTVDTTF